MAVLKKVAQMRKRLGYDDIATINDAIEEALESATVVTEDAIRTNLARATVDDIFFVVRGQEFNIRATTRFSNRTRPFGIQGLTPSGAVATELKLNRGFVDSGETIQVEAANTLRNVLGTGDGQLTDLKSPDDFTLLEADKGVMRIHEFLLTNCYVRVRYTAGFATDGGCPEKLVVGAGNEWVEELGALFTTLLLNGNPVVRRDPMDEMQVKTIRSQIDKIILNNPRYAPGAWKPDQSTVTLV